MYNETKIKSNKSNKTDKENDSNDDNLDNSSDEIMEESDDFQVENMKTDINDL